MTTEEFKIAYPEFSHLEGNELWDKMENMWLVSHENDLPKEVFDWKGNKIKVGDEICYIKTIEREYMRFVGVLFEGKMHENPEPPKPDTPCWEVGEYHIVFLHDGYLCIKTESSQGEYSFSFTQRLEMSFVDMNTHILVIKGISDYQH